MAQKNLKNKILDSITYTEVINELKREKHMRESVYPKLIKSGKMDRYMANRRQICLNIAINTLENAQKELEEGNKSKMEQFFDRENLRLITPE